MQDERRRPYKANASEDPNVTRRTNELTNKSRNDRKDRMSGVTVLHFWSTTCGPCRVIKPALEDLKEEFEGRIEWRSIDIHKDVRGIAAQFNIAVVPTLVVLKNGTEIGRHSGTQVAIFYTLIRKALAA